jgi:hypothetical protein
MNHYVDIIFIKNNNNNRDNYTKMLANWVHVSTTIVMIEGLVILFDE